MTSDKHAVSDIAVANVVNSNDEVIVISLEEAEIELEVRVPHIENVDEVLGILLLFKVINFLEIDDSLVLFLRRLRYLERLLFNLSRRFNWHFLFLDLFLDFFKER